MPITAHRQDPADSRFVAALGSHSLAELQVLQKELLAARRDGLTVGQMAVLLQHHSSDIAFWLVSRDNTDDDTTVTMLLGAVFIAITWQTYRSRPAPEFDIRRALERIEAGVAYALPIPRHEECFCGSESLYRDCHGQPSVGGTKRPTAS